MPSGQQIFPVILPYGQFPGMDIVQNIFRSLPPEMDIGRADMGGVTQGDPWRGKPGNRVAEILVHNISLKKEKRLITSVSYGYSVEYAIGSR